MKRPIVQTLSGPFAAMAVLALAACGEPAAPVIETPPSTDWVMSPEIDAVSGAGRELIVTGHASPLGRVVIKGAGDLAYAVAADRDGRFELRLPRPARDTLFQVEARTGETSLPAPYRLLIGSSPAAPTALLAIGAPTRRLDPGPGLDAVDSDGRAAFLSGRGAPDASVEVGGRAVVADATGRWRLAGAGNGGAVVAVAGQTYSPLPAGGTPDVLERAGRGWRIAWTSPGGGRQTTWFPDRPEDVRP